MRGPGKIDSGRPAEGSPPGLNRHPVLHHGMGYRLGRVQHVRPVRLAVVFVKDLPQAGVVAGK